MILLDDIVQVLALPKLDGQAAVGDQAAKDLHRAEEAREASMPSSLNLDFFIASPSIPCGTAEKPPYLQF